MKDILDKWLPVIDLDEELKTFEKKVNRLTDLESDILAAVDYAEIQPGRKRKREVESWLNNVTTKKSEFSLIKNEIKEKGSSRNSKSRIEKETKEVEELIQQGNFPKGVALDDHASMRLPMVTTKLVGQSFANNTEAILKLLKEDSVFVVGVYGMGGVGKTSLVKKIHNILMSDSDIARRVYWVTASRDCTLEKLQNDIGKEVGLGDISKEDNERKKAKLFHRFSTMEKSVLIIDDLWNHYLLERIGIPFESCCNCKVVITTRSWDICTRMQCQRLFKIEPLSKQDSWILFTRYSGKVPSDCKDIAERIVDESGGLPLALITMGYCMRDNGNVHDWKDALYELRKPASRQNEMEDEVFRILKFSFDNLKDVKVQNCFLNCLLFQEDEEICRDKLVNLCIDEGLLDEIENQQDKVNKGHTMLNRLVNACLLESGSYQRRMHDLIRDMGIIITQKHPRFIAKAGVQLEQVPEEEQWSIDLMKVSLSHNNITEEIPSGMAPMTPNLTVLMLNDNFKPEKIPESFFRHMKALRVLDLSCTGIMEVPDSVSDLVNLRVLLLECCHEFMYVPSVEKLTNLRELNLDRCYQLIRAPEGLERLKGAEIKLNYCPWDILSKKSVFNQLIQSSSISSSYKIWIRDPELFYSFEESKIIDEQMCEEDLNVVCITGWEYEEDESSWLLPNDLDMLGIEYSDMKGRSLGDALPSLGEATNLEEIRIEESRGIISITKVGALDSFSHLSGWK